jgi:hypothetical protein
VIAQGVPLSLRRAERGVKDSLGESGDDSIIMALDLSTQLMQATVQVEQRLPDGRHTIGTGFLINDPTPDGKPRTVLVTARHVFDRMPGATANIGYRVQDKAGGWSFTPQAVTIHATGRDAFVHHPTRDVVAIAVEAPPEFARAAIPLAWLAGPDTFTKYGVGPGDEMMVLGYPQGLSANAAGFPILRSGRVASPIEPDTVSPTFLLDFRVFPGNSGGPVFIAQSDHRAPGADAAQSVQFIAGMLTQQVELNDVRLELGIVTDAEFIRETIAELDQPATPSLQPRGATPALAPAQIATRDVSAAVGKPVGD